MASINGFELRNITEWEGHEGNAYQGDLYFNNEKIGFFSEKGEGGETDLSLDNRYSDIKLWDLIKELYKDKPLVFLSNGEEYTLAYDFDLMMEDFINLYDIESKFKDIIKQGYDGCIMVSDSYHVKYIKISKPDIYLNDDILIEKYNSFIERCKSGFYPGQPIELNVYRSEKDFQKVDFQILKSDFTVYKKKSEIGNFKGLYLDNQKIDEVDISNLSQEQQNLIDSSYLIETEDYGYYSIATDYPDKDSKNEIELEKD